MTSQVPVAVQKILGAFNPATGAFVGITLSGEAFYQNVPNALIAPTYAQVRTATHLGTGTIFTQGKVTPGDGLGVEFVYNPSDTTSGCVCVGSSAGTVLTVTAIQTGLIAVGATLSSSVTGLPFTTIASFGTGGGGVGTYNLTAPVNQAGPFTFITDSNANILVSVDGSRWYVSNTNFTGLTQILAPSGNSALNVTTPLYTFGNATDNPNFLFNSNGSFTINAPSSFQNTIISAPVGQAASLFLEGNGTSLVTGGILQYNASNNVRLKNLSATGSLILGANGADTITMTPAGPISVVGAPLQSTGPGMVTAVANQRAGTTLSITSNTVLTADPQLTVTIPQTGTWAMDGFLCFNELVSSAGGLQFDINASGGLIIGANTYSVNGFTTAQANTGGASITGGSIINFPTIAISTAISTMHIRGIFVNSVAGNLAIRLAQSASSANTTQVFNSYLMCTRIA